jgi:hypothetical protein
MDAHMRLMRRASCMHLMHACSRRDRPREERERAESLRRCCYGHMEAHTVTHQTHEHTLATHTSRVIITITRHTHTPEQTLQAAPYARTLAHAATGATAHTTTHMLETRTPHTRTRARLTHDTQHTHTHCTIIYDSCETHDS